MSNTGDILDQLWTQVINLDPQGQWIDACRKQYHPAGDPFDGVGEVLGCLLGNGCSREDLGRLGRFCRYEACFGTLYALEDPGLEKGEKGKIKGLHKLLLQAAPGNPQPPAEEADFLEACWENIGWDGDGEWLEDLANKSASTKPFGDAGPAIKRLIIAGAKREELARLAAWHSFEAVFHTLRLLEEAGFAKAQETFGLHESLLGADPSGKEGRPGSWPLPTPKAGGKNGRAAKPANPDEPCFKLKSLESFCFSNDSQWICGMGTSGPIRVFSATTGKEVAALSGLKGELRCFAISPDSKLIYAALASGLAICELPTGKVLHTVKTKGAALIDWDNFTRASGPLLLKISGTAENSVLTFSVLDPQTLQEKRKLEIPSHWGNLEKLFFSPDGTRLAILWMPSAGGAARMTIWSWPEASLLAEYPINLSLAYGWTPDSQFNVASGPVIYEALTGTQVWKSPEKWTDQVDVSSDGRWMVTGSHSRADEQGLQLWDLPQRKVVRHIPLPVSWCFGLQFSPNVELLGMASHRCCLFWRFPLP